MPYNAPLGVWFGIALMVTPLQCGKPVWAAPIAPSAVASGLLLPATFDPCTWVRRPLVGQFVPPYLVYHFLFEPRRSCFSHTHPAPQPERLGGKRPTEGLRM